MKAILILAALALFGLLSTVEKIPAQACQQTTYNGHYGMVNECR